MLMTALPPGLQAVVDELVLLRKERGWSQDKLAERSGVPRGTIANVERATHEPKRGNLRALAKALGADGLRWERMLDGKKPEPGRDASDLANLIEGQSPIIKRLMTEALLLPDDLQEHFAAVVSATLAALRAHR